ncbi:MAG: T9SS type A sorting domain-containing protein [Saprospiraceae bacterium]|nr:T9SS type A sorting domain-containing protein [Lewinella sp.]
MRTFLLILLLQFLLTTVNTQEYLSLIQEGGQWSQRHITDPWNTPEVYITEHFRIGKDTLIDSVRWHEIYFLSAPDFSWKHSGLQFGGYIREENQKVYYQGDLRDRSNFPMYDFSAEVGDTVWQGTDDTGSLFSLYVYKIDTVVYDDDIPRKRLHLTYYDHNSQYDYGEVAVWVEGLGDPVHGLLERHFMWDWNGRYGDRLLCYRVNDRLVFKSPDFPTCYEQNTLGLDTSISYLSLLEPLAEWTVTHTRNYWVGPGQYDYEKNIWTEHYRLGIDTVVDEQFWTNIYYSRDTFFNWNDPDLAWAGMVREEDRKVYYRGPIATFPGDLAYDFNMIKGDTLWHTLDYQNRPISLVVTEVDTAFLYDGLPRKRWHFRYYYHESEIFWDVDNLVWIEGLGDVVHGLVPRVDYQPESRLGNDRLLCFNIDGALIYGPFTGECFQESILVDTQEPVPAVVKVYPNPVLDDFYLETGIGATIDELMIFDAFGKMIHREIQPQGIGRYAIAAADWPAGLYFLFLRNGKSVTTIKLVKIGF